MFVSCSSTRKGAIWMSDCEDLPHPPVLTHTHTINTATHTSSHTVNGVISGSLPVAWLYHPALFKDQTIKKKKIRVSLSGDAGLL